MENSLNTELPCIFESSPPRLRWSCCAVSTFHIPQKEIKFLHYHPDMEVGVCAHGSGVLYLAGRKIPYTAGDVQVVLPRQPHYNATDAPDTIWHFISFYPSKLISEHITPDPVFLKDLTRSCKACGVFTAAENPELVRILTATAISAIKQPSSPFDEDLLVLQLLELLARLNTLGEEQFDSPEQINIQTDKIMPALIALSEAMDAGGFVTVPEMANACHFSQSYFRKLFFDTMGISPKSYLMKEQIKLTAQLLLTTSMPISEIQQRAGFSDSSVFFRNFVKLYQISPSAFRKQRREKRESPV